MLLELQQRSADLFNEADADQSGGLSFDEFIKAGAEKTGQAEGAPSLEDMFARLDQDRDGEVTLQEFASAKPQGREPAPSGSSPFEAMSALLDAQEQGV